MGKSERKFQIGSVRVKQKEQERESNSHTDRALQDTTAQGVKVDSEKIKSCGQCDSLTRWTSVIFWKPIISFWL